RDVRSAIIISSGFKEMGEAGRALEEEIVSIAKEYDMALLGPNCLGFLHPAIGLNASFAKRMPKNGDIAFFSQSGALCTALLDLSADSLGFSSFVSNGNKAVIGENELLRFFAQDEETNIISFYSEGLSDAPKIIETGRAILSRSVAKPIIALKSGVTEAGTLASSSHTGALAGSDAAYQALFKQARILRAENLETLLDMLTVFSHNPLPQGNAVGIITNAGGLGVLATDAAVTYGLTLAPLSPETKKKLEHLPPAAGKNNPVDVLGDALADRYRMALEALANDTSVDMLLIIVTPQTMTQAKETAEAIADVKQYSQKPIVAIYAGKESLAEGLTMLQKNNIATLTYPESGAQALSALWQIALWRKQFASTPFAFDDIDHATAQKIMSTVKNENRTALSEEEVSTLLRAYGFPLLESHIVTTREEALAITQKIGKPSVMKIVSPDIIHKSDVGGVILDVTPDTGATAFDQLMSQVKSHLPEARITGALIAEMVDRHNGHEIILGLKKEPALGTLVLAGLGGIYVETFKDVAMRFVPLQEEDASEMLAELQSYPLLQGARGQQGIHIPTLLHLIGRLSQLATDFPHITELDINPIVVFSEPENFRVLDARISVE
ncbi:MAG TPA: acetate--CoA ligase family protein, partial [Patescibacteria group bacterium]|nr:acetate--CoA ligase family protein [Patescibacteria group bacterium]